MKKLLLLTLVCNLAWTQDDFGAGDVKDVQVVKNKKSGSWDKLLRKNISGSVGHASIFGTGDEYRSYSHARLRFSKAVASNTKLVMEALFESTKIEFMQKPDTTAGGNIGDPDIELKYSRSNFRAEEAFVEQEFLDKFSIALGIQKIVWGQFEPFSPTNLVFPFNFSSTDVEFSKVKGTLPQKAVTFRYYPSAKVSLSIYAFPDLSYDEIIQKQIDNPGTYRPLDGSAAVPEEFILPSDKMQKGLRLMFYPAWGTIGFSYYDGYDTSQPFEEATLSGTNITNYRKTKVTKFNKRKMYGFEMAYPKGNWVHKVEYSMSKTKESLSLEDQVSGSGSFSLEPGMQNFLNAVINDNDRNLFIPTNIDILAIGSTGELKKWFFNLMLFYYSHRYDDKGEKLVDLQKKSRQEEDEGYDGPFFPGIIMSRYLNSQKSSEFGMALGIINNGQGGAFFYKKTTDSLVYGLALQAITYFSDDIVADSFGTEGYERKNSTSTGLLGSITYKF